jgi:type I restriction enzyme, S subunit
VNNGLPQGWSQVPLRDLFELKYGKALPQDKRNAKGSVKVYGSNGVVGLHNAAVTRGLAIVIGRKGSVGEVHLSDQPCWPIDTTYFIDEFPPNFPKKYWALYLKSLRLGQQEKSSAIPGISRDDVYPIEIPVPPLPEQRRIVAKLEKLLAKVDACQQRLAKIPLLLKRFRQSVLAAACSGRLTADWREENRNGEPASELLNRIHAKPLEGNFDIPETWCWAKFADIVSNHDGRRIPVKQSDRDKRSGPYPYYGAFGVIDDIDGHLFDGEYLLLAEDGKNLESRLRSISLIASGKFWVNNHAHILQSKGGIPLAFLNAWFNSPTLDLSAFLTGIDQVKLNRAQMDRIPVPVAPLPEQREIVRRVESLFALADEIEARFKKAQAHMDKLTPSLLARAFRGQLVPQDPNDEPAATLVKRIRENKQEINEI